jgi:hypothetical protein
MFTRTITCCLVAAALLCLAGCSTVYMKATPFYTGETEGPAERRVNLWPALYYREPALSVLWPLIEVTDDHKALHPLVSVYKLDKQERQWNFLWPLAQFDFDTDNHRVFPVFWGDDYFVAFPEVWWFEESKGVFPVFWWGSGFTVFPLAWYERDERFNVFPLWLHSKSAGGHDTWALWPIFRLKRQGEERGFHVWPLIGAYEEEDSSYKFAMWPLCHAWRDGDDSLVLTPLWCSGVRGDSEWNLLFPLYYASTNPSADEERLLTPLLGRMRSGDRTRWILTPILSSAAWGEDEKDIWMLGPLAHFRWGGDNVQQHVVPLYYYNRNNKMFLSPLISWGGGEKGRFVNLLTLLAQYSEYDDGGRTFRLLPPLTGVSWGGRHRRVEGWLFSCRMSQKGGKKAHYIWLAPSIYWERDFGKRGWSRDPDGTQWKGDWRRNGFFPLWHYQSHEDAAGERRYRDFSLLGLVYDYRLREGRPAREDAEKTEDYVQARVLWRLFHYERLDEDKSVDVFPAITWDSRADGYRQFSFIWRLFRIERTGDGRRNLDFLFIPLMRESGAEADLE